MATNPHAGTSRRRDVHLCRVRRRTLELVSLLLTVGLWLGSANAEYLNPPFDRMTVTEGLPSGDAHYVKQDLEGYLWIGTADGLARYDGYAFEVFHADADDARALPRSNVQSLLVDPTIGFGWAQRAAGSACWTSIARFLPITGPTPMLPAA